MDEMSISILHRYKRSNVKHKNSKIKCEDCLYFNPFGKFCEFKLKTDLLISCKRFEDRKRDLLKKTKTLGELPKKNDT